jgi:Fe-S cluster biosynthesis and repair protein YggX
MTRLVFCEHLQKELEGLERPPYPGEIGEKIYNSVSKQAWQMWLEHQTMLLNENRLSMVNPESRKYLQEEMIKFFFGGGSQKPMGYVPPKEKLYHLFLQILPGFRVYH